MAGKPELSGISVVGAGAFNPAISHPSWFREQSLLAENDAEHALGQLAVTPQLTAFTGGWLTVQVTDRQAVFSTVDEARELELRDLAKNVFELLPHTPLNAVGINADTHFRLNSEEAWHEVGDTFLPKERWDPLFAVEGQEWMTRSGDRVTGMRSMVVEAWRSNRRDYVRVEVAPSVRIGPHGVFVGVNSHFQISYDDTRGTALQGAEVIADAWDATRNLEKHLREQVMEWVP